MLHMITADYTSDNRGSVYIEARERATGAIIGMCGLYLSMFHPVTRTIRIRFVPAVFPNVTTGEHVLLVAIGVRDQTRVPLDLPMTISIIPRK